MKHFLRNWICNHKVQMAYLDNYILPWGWRGGLELFHIPSDTKIVVTTKAPKHLFLQKLRFSCVIPWKYPSFPKIEGAQHCFEATKIICHLFCNYFVSYGICTDRETWKERARTHTHTHRAIRGSRQAGLADPQQSQCKEPFSFIAFLQGWAAECDLRAPAGELWPWRCAGLGFSRSLRGRSSKARAWSTKINFLSPETVR